MFVSGRHQCILTTLKRYVNKMRNINGPTSVHISFDGSNVGGRSLMVYRGYFPKTDQLLIPCPQVYGIGAQHRGLRKLVSL